MHDQQPKGRLGWRTGHGEVADRCSEETGEEKWGFPELTPDSQASATGNSRTRGSLSVRRAPIGGHFGLQLALAAETGRAGASD